ncbi:hypothetical protein CUMW_203910 [Citrus unshiu]|uniref:CRIB domain-containing protein n=1 Tax=Citrus unshiu TaxID=55188 RepID=A0A2H5Q8U7_CITUN|nr:hypothetical protein CUMW_203910 [Citrus unshiu]
MGRRQKEREQLKRNRTSSRWWREDVISAVHNMEIGCPTNVRHITHATFDRFNDFLGLPVEFEVEVPCRVPSASEKFEEWPETEMKFGSGSWVL